MREIKIVRTQQDVMERFIRQELQTVVMNVHARMVLGLTGTVQNQSCIVEQNVIQTMIVLVVYVILIVLALSVNVLQEFVVMGVISDLQLTFVLIKLSMFVKKKENVEEKSTKKQARDIVPGMLPLVQEEGFLIEHSCALASLPRNV